MYEAKSWSVYILRTQIKRQKSAQIKMFWWLYDDIMMMIYYHDIVRTLTKGQESMQPQMMLSSMLSLVTMLKRTQVHDDDEMGIMIQQIIDFFHDIPKGQNQPQCLEPF